MFRGCRAWWNSDDGFDLIDAFSSVTIENSWAWRNGYPPETTTPSGNGNGFKMGGYGGKYVSFVVKHTIRNSAAFNNKAAGFHANHHTLENDYFTQHRLRQPPRLQHARRQLGGCGGRPGNPRNNLAYQGTLTSNMSGTNASYNSWNLDVTLSDTQLRGMSTSVWDAARQFAGAAGSPTGSGQFADRQGHQRRPALHRARPRTSARSSPDGTGSSGSAAGRTNHLHGGHEVLTKNSRRTFVSIFLSLAVALVSAGGAAAETPAPRIAAAATIQNDVFWKDTSGNPIYSQGGGVLKVGNTYYWYGAKYNGAVSYYNNPAAGKNGDTSLSAITIYSSTDLANWKFEGNALTGSDLGGGWVGRIGVARNANTGKYVLVSQLNSGLVFATSSTPNGRFTRAGTQSSIANVSTGMSGDQSVFTDDDGKAYLIYSNKSGRSHLYVSSLRASDYLQVDPAKNVYNSSAGGREGNVMFKYNGTYYFCSSDLHGWNASHTYCISAKNIMGPYSAEFVLQGTDADFSHVTQTGLAFTVTGSSGSFVVFGGDRWSDFAGNGIGYNQWLPVTFNGSTPVFHSLSQWTVDAAAGAWSAGRGNNYVLNPSAEADRVAQNDLAGWATTGGTVNSNKQGGRTGRWAFAQSSSSAYNASRYQDISLPNGTYTLSAWVKSSGGQKKATIFAKNFGAGELSASISQSLGNWTKVSVSGITVTNGSIQAGLFSDANAGNWVNVDDFSLVQNG